MRLGLSKFVSPKCPENLLKSFSNMMTFFSGKYIDCSVDFVPGRAAMGRCSTSRNISAGGDCGDDRSHGVRCCQTEYRPDYVSCGWTFASYGVKLDCPAGFAATGYCGVNNKGDCIGGNFLGINCCKFNPA